MSRPGRPLVVRLYGALVALLPSSLREGFGTEVEELFHDLYRDARRDGVGSGLALFARSVWGLLLCALHARRDERRGWYTTGLREARPDRGGAGMLAGMIQDARYALRSLAKAPGFALTATLILGAGIGATTTIFSVVDTVVLRSLPYPEASRLVHFDEGSHTYPSFASWSEMESFELLSAARDVQVALTGLGAPERLDAAAVSQDFFQLFGAAPHIGRLFVGGDYPGDRSVTVLSHGFWTRLGGDPSILGSTLTIDGAPTTVVGVLERDFVPPSLATGSSVDLWFALGDGGENANDHGYHVLGVAARLVPGVALEAAQAEVDAQRTAIADQFPRNYINRDGSIWHIPLVEMHEATVREVTGTLYLLLGAVGMMLLIACANVANLFLARGTVRSREIALRGALGASRGRIASQIFTESLLLALAGGALGVALAFLGVELLGAFMPQELPRIDALEVDLRIMWFSVVVSVGTGLLFGTLPALQALREDVNDALKDGALSVTAGRRGRRARSLLVVSEVALAVVLLAGAGLLFRSLVERLQVDPGFDTEQIVRLPLELEAGYDETRRAQFVEELVESVEAMPGTRAVALGWTLPFTYTGGGRCCWRTPVRGDPALADEENPFRSLIHPVSDGYFAALGAELLSGRELDYDGQDADRPVAILNAPAAEALFGDVDPVGRTVEFGGESVEVVGVARGVHHWGLSDEIEVAVYVPYARHGLEFGMLEIALRTDASLETAAQQLRDAVWAIDPDLPVGSVTTMEGKISESLTEPRFLSGLLGSFALIAVILACGGIYGSMLYTVGQRRHEMGIRLALGANGSDVVRLVLSQGIRLAVAGVLIGTVVGLGLSRVMERLVWGIQPTDPATFAAAAIFLGATAILSSLLPAWRAGRTDPLQTLKAE